MNADIESIYQAAINLNPEDREDLAERILRSLDDSTDLPLTPEQAAEIQRRVQSVRDGTAKLISMEEAFERVTRALQERTQA